MERQFADYEIVRNSENFPGTESMQGTENVLPKPSTPQNRTRGKRITCPALQEITITGGDSGGKRMNALINECHVGNIARVRRLLSLGVNPNAAVNKGIYKGLTALMTAASYGHAEVVKVLLSAKANPNAANKSGWTALIYAASKGHVEVVEILLSAGANPNAVDNEGWTALDFAKHYDFSEIKRILLAAGAK